MALIQQLGPVWVAGPGGSAQLAGATSGALQGKVEVEAIANAIAERPQDPNSDRAKVMRQIAARNGVISVFFAPDEQDGGLKDYPHKCDFLQYLGEFKVTEVNYRKLPEDLVSEHMAKLSRADDRNNASFLLEPFHQIWLEPLPFDHRHSNSPDEEWNTVDAVVTNSRSDKSRAALLDFADPELVLFPDPAGLLVPQGVTITEALDHTSPHKVRVEDFIRSFLTDPEAWSDAFGGDDSLGTPCELSNQEVKHLLVKKLHGVTKPTKDDLMGALLRYAMSSCLRYHRFNIRPGRDMKLTGPTAKAGPLRQPEGVIETLGLVACCSPFPHPNPHLDVIPAYFCLLCEKDPYIHGTKEWSHQAGLRGSRPIRPEACIPECSLHISSRPPNG